MTDLPDLAGAGVVSAVREGRISVREVVTACFDRIARLEPAVRAWVVLDRDGALRQADDLDARIARGDQPPLAGLPFGVKDIIDVAGLATTAGFAPFKDRIAERDAVIVERLRALGAVPLGKTHTTQFAFSDAAPTNNPYLLTHSPGGSSSGSGAAVGARMVPLALGTQTAGSVLRPAAYCGAVGFKPTFNWISRAGVIPLSWSLDHLGLIARDVVDTDLIFRAVTGTQSAGTGPQRPPRLAVLTEFVERADPEIGAQVRHAADRLAAAGAEVEDLRLPIDLDLILAVHRVIMQAEVGAIHAEMVSTHRDDYGPIIATEVELAQLIPATFELKSRRLRRKIFHEIDALLATYDAWLLPTASILPPARSAGSTGDPSFQAPWTMLGTPSISLPGGISASGLPIGIQLVGRRGADGPLLSVASWSESVLGGIAAPDMHGSRASS